MEYGQAHYRQKENNHNTYLSIDFYDNYPLNKSKHKN